ncbi:hypothetical protein MMC22_003993 [Lobaria immixta]|nr:hypothetical protein [Lobaria immixta]
MNAAKSSHAFTSRVSSRRGTRNASQAAKKNETNASLSAQQPAIGVVVSSDGKTRTINGAMEYEGDMDGVSFQQFISLSAIYHDDIRGHLLAEGPQGIYDIPRQQGKGKDDVTSFHPDYKTNGPDRENRHKILFRYKQNGYAAPSYTPETWVYRGQIVLNPQNDPVPNWHETSLLLSSAYEGYDMEVVRRLNPNIKIRDFRARMPRTIFKGSPRGFPGDRDCHDDNSMENFHNLTELKPKEARRLKKWKFLNRAGKHALDEATRQNKDEVEQQR